MLKFPRKEEGKRGIRNRKEENRGDRKGKRKANEGNKRKKWDRMGPHVGKEEENV